MSLVIPMIAGMGEVEGIPTSDGTLLGELARDLEITERLIALQAEPISDVRAMLIHAQNYLHRTPLFDGEEDERAARLAELEQEIARVSGMDQAAPAPESLWPAQRRAIERAYQWAEQNGAQIELEAGKAQARADALDRLLGMFGDGAGSFGSGIERTVQQAIKWAAIGLLVYGGVMLLPGLLASFGKVSKGAR